MEETGTECSMCGDVGFPDKLFQCKRCRSRFQHSYCSNYYEEQPTERAGVCDWCLSAERSTHGGSGPSKKADSSHGKRFECLAGSDDKAARGAGGDREDGSGTSRGKGSGSSSKPTTRRYKLLKDVLC